MTWWIPTFASTAKRAHVVSDFQFKDMLSSSIRSMIAYKSKEDVHELWAKANTDASNKQTEEPVEEKEAAEAAEAAEAKKEAAKENETAGELAKESPRDDESVESVERLMVFELQHIEHEPVLLESDADAQCYVWIKDSTAYVTFRGTSSIEDALADANVLTWNLPNGVKIHRGFYTQFLSIRDGLYEWLGQACTEDITCIHFAGHSLGAALAQIAAHHFGPIFTRMQVTCSTIGCPRTGNTAFAQSFERVVTQNMRVANANDPVTMIPLSFRWWHTFNKCMVIDDDCSVKYVKSDIPWYYRIFMCAKDIDYNSVIHDHTCDTYVARLMRLSR